MKRSARLVPVARVLVRGLLVAALCLAASPTTAFAGCETKADCEVGSLCVDGQCVAPGAESSVAKVPPGAKTQDATGALPPGRTKSRGTARLDDILRDLAFDQVSPLIISLVALLVLHRIRKRRYLFLDYAGERLLHIGLVALKNEKDLAEIPLVAGELIARLHGLERHFASRLMARKAALPKAVSLLVNHPRFEELEQLAAGSGGSDPAFAKLRKALAP